MKDIHNHIIDNINKVFESEGETEIKADVGLAFYTEKEGYCDLKFNNQEFFNDYFDYYADGKLLVIRGSSVERSWLFTSKSKKKIVLEKE